MTPILEQPHTASHVHYMGVLVLAWPGGKMLRGMEDMLHAMQHDRSRGANIQQAFDAQHGFSVHLQQHAEPDAKGNPSASHRMAVFIALTGLLRQRSAASAANGSVP